MAHINIDDRIKCIKADSYPLQTGVGSGLILNREYIAYGLKRETCCGNLVVDIGMTSKEKFMSTCLCGVKRQEKGTKWKSASRFVKAIEKEDEAKVSAIKLVEKLVLSEN